MAAARKILDRVMTRCPHQFLLSSSHRSGDNRRYLSGDNRRYLSGDNRQYLTGGMLSRQQQLPLKLGGEFMIKNEFKVSRCKSFMNVWSNYRQLSTTTVKPIDDDDVIKDDVIKDDDDVVVVKADDDDILDYIENEDYLGAEKLGKKFLIRSYKDDDDDDDKQQPERVPVESLRGKIVGLYFEKPSLYYQPLETRLSCAFREFYNTLKQTKPDSFEMIYVPPFPPKHQDQEAPSVGNGNGNTHVYPLPPKHDPEEPEEDPSVHNDMISTLPWLSIPVDDLHWRAYLHHAYFGNPYDYPTDITFIDTRNNWVERLWGSSAVLNIHYYGPHYYPFTDSRLEQLWHQTHQFAKETSIQAILGSNSRDYLIDRHSNKVPISSLQNKDVLLFGYSSQPTSSESRCLERLLEIYNEFPNHSFEIVSINFDYKGGNEEKQKLWIDHLAQIPWLSLPFGDEKTWPLREISLTHTVLKRHSDPFLFVKPKGDSVLDPYGYRMLEIFGIRAFPYTRKAAAECLVKRVKGLSFKSYVDEASELGLDFNSLIRNKDGGGIEHVSLSTILEGKARGILLLFASLGFLSPERLKSLIGVYQGQNESSSSFEVIFVSLDKTTRSFNKHFSSMPWFAFQRPIKREELMTLAKRSTKIHFNAFSHFLAFGPDQLLLQAGLITKSFENCEFPFINDAESSDHVAFRIARGLHLEQQACGTPCYEGDGWWRGIEYKDGPGIDAGAFDRDDWFYDGLISE